MANYVNVQIDVNDYIDDIDDDDLIQEMKNRGYFVSDNKPSDNLGNNLLENSYFEQIERLYNTVSLRNLDKLRTFIDELK